MSGDISDLKKTNFLYASGTGRGGDYRPNESQETLIVPPIHAERPSDHRIIVHLLGWPALVVLGQLGLQAVGWIFLAVVTTRGPIALPYSTAVWASENAHLVPLIATLIATLFAGCSSFFFSYALRRSMALYLRRPMSLEALGASVSISMRTLVFNRRNWKWPAISLLCFIIAGIQTSGWSTLITPVKVTVSTPLAGLEIDLSSPVLQQIASNGLSVCEAAEGDTEVYGGVPASGYASGQAYLGLPAAVSLLGKGFNVSTRGILAATLNDTTVGSWFIPATAKTTKTPPTGISSSYSMTQQGFTADVSCSQQTLTNTTSPGVWFDTDTVSKWEKMVTAQEQMNYVIAYSSCAAKENQMNITDAYFKASGQYLWAVGCDPEPSAPNNYTLIFGSSGNYTGITGSGENSYMVCDVAPRMTVVQADYIGESISPIVDVSKNSSTAVTAGGAAGVFAMYILTDLVWHQQGITVNGVADQLLELSDTMQGGDEQRFKITEQYLQGVVEYSGSVLRACLSAKDLAFAGGVPLNMTVPTTGTWNTETMGWKGFSSGTTVWILLPGLFMAFATLALVIIAVYRHWDALHTDSHGDTFDPSNPLHLIAVASAGGLQHVFKGFRDDDIDEGAKLDVLLGSVPGRGPALVRADTYAPVVLDRLDISRTSSRV
ncbi:hypothetical protein FB45DRAFT_908828 [Roridomyces roridus]|uniref:Uncharacterized protein n=1 Tax=Roridomyces roridus TaxID=1738132 RepID=A0AAD7BYE8_9AGAR|nr:hypothetical protein FB45DRAFT_908828 [Roridomyces roridus]